MRRHLSTLLFLLYIFNISLSFAKGDDYEYPPTALEGISSQIKDIAASTKQIEINVALGQRDIATFAAAFKEEKQKTSDLQKKTDDLEKDILSTKHEIKSNTGRINLIEIGRKEDEAKSRQIFFTIFGSIVTTIGLVIGGILKLRANKTNHEDLKKLVDAKEKK